jgi:glycerol-3-phosphate dehydrogenase
MNRQQILNALRSQPEISVLIIGAGINGIGTFRDLAMQGVDVLLIDKSDFCAGASAASSHMVHGGLRYLENAEFRLVREALAERNRLLQNAPHYVKPLPTTIPIFKWLSGTLNAPLKFLNLRNKPGERGALVIKIGLTLYDWFTRGQQTLPRHKFFSKRASLEKRPKLNPQIICTAQYYDAWMPYPERLCMELIMDAEADCDRAWALNYVSAASANQDRVTLRDEVTTQEYIVKPKVVINATGAWIDLTNKALKRGTRYIGGTKGSHLIVDHPELHAATDGNEIFFENKDGRIVLFFPLEDRVLMGTTDIPVNDPENAVCTEEEVDYILEMVQKVFPAIKVDRSQIVFHFSGVRPLPSSHAATAGQISRDHSIHTTEPNGEISFPIFSLVGGKWTTYRAFSEETADKALERLKLARKTRTDRTPIGGGKGYPRGEAAREQWVRSLAEKHNLPLERAQTLFKRYGTYADKVATFLTAERDETLHHHPDYTQREILFIAAQEKIIHLDDLLLRRTPIAMLGQINGDLLQELATLLSTTLGWDEAQTRQETERTAALLKQQHGVDAERLHPTEKAGP